MTENKTRYTEEELINQLRFRDAVAFSYLYDNYSGALYSIIKNIVGEGEEASDVLQDVFVKIWRNIENYDSTKGRLFTWMLNVARNTAIDLVRSKDFRNQQQNQELTEDVYGAVDKGVVQVDTIGLRKFVNILKPELKQVLELAYFKGFTQDEISKLLNIPLGTVKTRIRTGLIQLRSMIEDRE